MVKSSQKESAPSGWLPVLLTGFNKKTSYQNLRGCFGFLLASLEKSKPTVVHASGFWEGVSVLTSRTKQGSRSKHATRFLSGWPQKGPNLLFTTRMVQPQHVSSPGSQEVSQRAPCFADWAGQRTWEPGWRGSSAQRPLRLRLIPPNPTGPTHSHNTRAYTESRVNNVWHRPPSCTPMKPGKQ